MGKDNPPCTLITGTTPPPPSTQRPTPPVLRRFSSSISSYVTVEPCEIWLEIIPDALDSRPPPPTFPLSHIVHYLPHSPDAFSPPFTSESPTLSLLTPTVYNAQPPHRLVRNHTSSRDFGMSSPEKEHKGILIYEYNDTRKDKMCPYSHSYRNYKTGEIKAKSLMRTESKSDLEDFGTSQANFLSYLDLK